MDLLFDIWPMLWYPSVELYSYLFSGLAVRYMAGDVVSSCSVIKELVTLAAGQYKGDSFEIGKFDFFLKPIGIHHEDKKFFHINLDFFWLFFPTYIKYVTMYYGKVKVCNYVLWQSESM